MDLLLGRLQRALQGRYAVEHELGRGGMATVFLGHDLRLQRRVAIKVFEEDGGLIAAGERFLREIRIAAQLQHPNILPVFESGEGEGLVYYVMPYVSGGSLRERLEREGPLPVADAVRIGREVAEALDHAHRAGIVHRDIKPDNIMLADGVAVVADFGIARGIEQGGGKVTETGLAIGTPTYMSPEQAAASPQVDGRTDLYALGCVVYEMLAGSPPFGGPTAQVVMARHATDVPPPLQTIRTLPPGLEPTVQKALAKLPGDRWTTGKVFGAALEKALANTEQPAAAVADRRTPDQPFSRGRRALALAATGLTLLLVGALYAWNKGRPAEDGADSHILMVVLPFEAVGDSAEAYFADGMTDEVRGKLSGLPGFQMIARSSAIQYRGTTKSLREVAQELGVRYLLTGTVRRVRSNGEDRLEVRPELVEVLSSGTTIARWNARFDAQRVDVFQVQSSIAAQVAEELRVAVSPSTAPLLATAPTDNLAAYDEFLRGEQAYLGSSGYAARARALEHYGRAVALDSTFARAWGRISQVQSSMFTGSLDSGTGQNARQAAEKVLALAPRLPEAHLAMGSYHLLVRNDYQRAAAALKDGLALAPASAELLGNLGLAEQGLGNLDLAIDYMRRGLELDPRSLLYSRRLTRALTWAHRFAEAEAMARRAIAIAPADAAALQYAAHIRLAQGDLDGAHAYFHAIPPGADSLGMILDWTLNPTNCAWAIPEDQRRLALGFPPSMYRSLPTRAYSVSCVARGLGYPAMARALADSAFTETTRLDDRAYFLALLGRRDEAIALAEEAFTGFEGDMFVGPTNRHFLIQTLILAGAVDKALDHLEVLMGVPYYITPAWLRIDPTFDPLRQHPRFRKLLAER